MKRCYLALLIFLFIPMHTSAENQKITFLPSDIQLQGKSTVVCDTPYFQIILPANWVIKKHQVEKDWTNEDVIWIAGNSPNGHIRIQIFSSVGKGTPDKLIDSWNKTTWITKKQTEKFSLSGANSVMVSGLMSINNDLHYQISYEIYPGNKVISISALIKPESYDQESVLIREIVNTLKFKN
ncbi:Hypothetical protein LUCI_0651 [Lucifera butyrica]|uniref:DUF1795 domain-containing protein n=1 Tax=Lucifera butyrica TaxID=1351585 RepID=A0A498R229_9FIRM|nr:hypothetical protein [Lucifera butyrica]VBB05441.1 Hypothetical protein LUCI_0651 [Lucifera butyrica]